MDVDGACLGNAVVAQIPGRAPAALAVEDEEAIGWSRLLLFLAALSNSDYFTQADSYTNGSAFELIFQRFLEPANGILLNARRRDGVLKVLGYRHVDVRFSVPLAARHAIHSSVSLDRDLLSAIDRAGPESLTVQRLRMALPFLLVAIGDSPLLTPLQEAILMSPAFEQLLGFWTQEGLAEAFHQVFERFGSVTADAAQGERPGIPQPEKEKDWDQEKTWWVHRHWARELYRLRSKAIHKGTTEGHQWGWLVHEHMVIGSFVFPLMVKLLLAVDRHYELSEEDEARGRAVDRLLSITDWQKREEGALYGRWAQVLRSVRKEVRHERQTRTIAEVIGHSDTEGGT